MKRRIFLNSAIFSGGGEREEEEEEEEKKEDCFLRKPQETVTRTQPSFGGKGFLPTKINTYVLIANKGLNNCLYI